MPELRRHYFLQEYCVIASERQKRPSDFQAAGAKEKSTGKCPFCPGNEEMTPPATAVYREDGVCADGEERVRGWFARAFPNLYPAMVPDPAPATADWTALRGRGYHEVIIESPEHGKSPAGFSEEQMQRLVGVYRDRYIHYKKMPDVRFVSIFKNWGREAGASLSHTHSQLIALPLLPPLLMREREAMASWPSCPYCAVADRESSSPRLVAGNRDWILLAPFFSQSPYETWILPRRHYGDLEELDRERCESLAQIMGEGLGRLSRLLKDPPYNLMIYQLSEGYHLNIRIQPVLSKMAGFEKNTGICINTVPPEQAAIDLLDA
ncbi:MAG: DUF4931 domain-containing protein [Methanosarcinales archaeon]|nr:DUF4931 domain-containing protein [Methanosarcinales archaeon]